MKIIAVKISLHLSLLQAQRTSLAVIVLWPYSYGTHIVLWHRKYSSWCPMIEYSIGSLVWYLSQK